MYKRGTLEYDLWRASPKYDLYCKRISVAKTGKHHSAETRAKIRVANIGKHPSEETLIKMREAQSGERHPFYGKHHSEKSKRKMSEAKKGQLRPEFSGSNHPMWRGGISVDPYPAEWTAILREAIRKRDNYTCVLCRKVQGKKCHAVHHIDYDKQNLCSENLITLCTVCHCKTNDNREYWENLLKTMCIPNFPKERMMKDESYC